MADITKISVDTAGKGVSTGVRLLHSAPVPFVAGGILALLSEWDHEHEKIQIREEYESEISAQTGKPPELVRVRDMEQVAKINPTIGEALRRSRMKRNLSIGITLIGTVASVGLSMVLGPMIVGALGLGAATSILAIGAVYALHGLVGFTGFMAVEKILDSIGQKRLHLEEPSIQEVERKPARQSELSVPSQVHYLGLLQDRRITISQEQVLTTFIAADPMLALDIASQYGAPFAKLPDATRAHIITQLEPQFHLEQITEDLNNRLVRAQELAFTVQGQTSGVPKLETPHATALEHAHAELQQKLALAQHKISELHKKVHEQAALAAAKVHTGADTAMEKMGFRKASVSGVPLQVIADKVPTAPFGKFTARERAPVTSGSKVEQLMAERQQVPTQALSV